MSNTADETLKKAVKAYEAMISAYEEIIKNQAETILRLNSQLEMVSKSNHITDSSNSNKTIIQ